MNGKKIGMATQCINGNNKKGDGFMIGVFVGYALIFTLFVGIGIGWFSKYIVDKMKDNEV